MSDVIPGSRWSLEGEIERINGQNLSYENRIIAFMHAYHTDMVFQAQRFADAKADHDRLKAIHTMDKRYGRNGLDPEKSGEMCTVYAEAQEDVYMMQALYTKMVHFGQEREAMWALHKAEFIADNLVARVLS